MICANCLHDRKKHCQAGPGERKRNQLRGGHDNVE